MKLIKCLIVFLVVGVFYFVPGLAKASYITFSGATGVIDGDYNDCVVDINAVTVTSGGSDCVLYFSIPIASGQTLSSVTIYYYDNSGSQSLYGELIRLSLSAGSYSTLVSGSDTSTSASVQSKTLSYGSATSSSYAYSVQISLDYGTLLYGIKVYYY